MTAEEALQSICAAWSRLDNDALADLFADDGLFEDPLHERALRGREDIRATNAPAMEALSECEVTLRTLAGDGTTALAEGAFASALREGGRLDFPFAMVVEMRDGRIARLSEYFDTRPLV